VSSRACRRCGCTDDHACLDWTVNAGADIVTPCWWVADDLCSACAHPDGLSAGQELAIITTIVATDAIRWLRTQLRRLWRRHG
jgi:hypothetical protein